MGGGGSNFCVHARGSQALLRQHGIVVAMNDVMRDARMMGLFLENRLEDLAAPALICKGLVRCRCNDVKSNRVKDCGFRIVGVSGLQFTHLFLEGAVIGSSVLAAVIGSSVLAAFCIHFLQGVDVRFFTARGGRVGSCDLLCLSKS